MFIELVPDLNAEFPLSSDAIPQPIQLFVLRSEHLSVVRMYLLVVEVTLVRWRFWIIAVGKERRSVGIFIY